MATLLFPMSSKQVLSAPETACFPHCGRDPHLFPDPPGRLTRPPGAPLSPFSFAKDGPPTSGISSRHICCFQAAHPNLLMPESGGAAGNFTYGSSYDLDYKLSREDVPYRVYEYQRIPPLINHVPVKIRRTQVGMGVKSSFSPHKGPRKSHLPQEHIKLHSEELYSIRRELNQIKAQVDRLLENLERMDQQRDQLPGQGPPTGDPGHTLRSEASEENRAPVSKSSSCRITEAKQDPRGQRAHPEADSPEDSTDPEEAVKNHVSDQESSQ
ncbi:uncharacterized protein LOC144225138 [Crocuta crocuta]